MIFKVAALILGATWLYVRDSSAFHELADTSRRLNLELERQRVHNANHHAGDTATIEEWGRGA